MEKDLRFIIAKNLSDYRKLNGFTQLDIAEKLNYTDKAVSKWERGESTPDIFVLNELAEFYGITVNDLLSETKPKHRKSAVKRVVLVPIISTVIVWLVAIVAFTVCTMLPIELPLAWLSFIYAIPVSAIVLTVYSSIWWNQITNMICTSAIIWSVTLSVVTTASATPGISLLWTVAAVLQVMELLWFILRYRKTKQK